MTSHQVAAPPAAYRPASATPAYPADPAHDPGHFAHAQDTAPNDTYGQLLSYTAPRSGTQNTNVPGQLVKPLPVIRGPEVYTTRIAISPEDATSSSTSGDTTDPAPPAEAPGFFPSPRPAPKRVSFTDQPAAAAAAAAAAPPAIAPRAPASPPTTPADGVARIVLGDEPEVTPTPTVGAWSRDTVPSVRNVEVVEEVEEEEEEEEEEAEVAPAFARVGIVCDETMAVMVQIACESEEGANHEKFADLVAAVTIACDEYFIEKETEKEAMDASQVEQVVMADNKQVKQHIAEISEVLGEHVTITRADCRQVNSKGYVGTYVQDNVTYKGRSSVSKRGVIVVLKKLNKFACCKEFSEQLSLHILSTQPKRLGKGELSTTVEDRKLDLNPRNLLTQRFYCDQTCNVYEAGKRSFVEVSDFVLY